MPYASLFRILVPDAPLHRRTDRNSPSSLEAALRVDATNFLRELPVKPGLQEPHLVSTYNGSFDTLLFALPQ